MKSMGSDWYKKVWTLDIQNQSWTEDTKRQVDFIIRKLRLNGGERILDLACGFGRHSLELARRGFSVTGVDITPEYIRFAREEADREGLRADFLCQDIRETRFSHEFDAVINMADGAVGYLENDTENGKIFTVVSNALKTGGKHFMDIMNGGYADSHFLSGTGPSGMGPSRLWEAGEKCLTLSEFEWDKKTRVLLYGQRDFEYGKPLSKPDISEGNPIRLYTLDEVKDILSSVGMSVTGAFADYDGTPSSDDHIQLMVCSEKTK